MTINTQPKEPTPVMSEVEAILHLLPNLTKRHAKVMDRFAAHAVASCCALSGYGSLEFYNVQHATNKPPESV